MTDKELKNLIYNAMIPNKGYRVSDISAMINGVAQKQKIAYIMNSLCADGLARKNYASGYPAPSPVYEKIAKTA